MHQMTYYLIVSLPFNTHAPPFLPTFRYTTDIFHITLQRHWNRNSTFQKRSLNRYTIRKRIRFCFLVCWLLSLKRRKLGRFRSCTKEETKESCGTPIFFFFRSFLILHDVHSLAIQHYYALMTTCRRSNACYAMSHSSPYLSYPILHTIHLSLRF